MKGGLFMIVALDGSGDFIKIQDAVDSIPDKNSKKVVIKIKNGVYREKLFIEKPFVSLQGEDVEKTIITYDDYAMMKQPDGSIFGSFNSYTAFMGGDNFSAENITFQNTAGRGATIGQGLAAYVDGDRAIFRNCRFLGHQDTLFMGPLPPYPLKRPTFEGPRVDAPKRLTRQYYENCFIKGDVDFIYGSAVTVFKDCEIFSCSRVKSGDMPSSGVNGWYTAASTPEGEKFGYVFINCRLTSDAPANSVYLGRPWRNYAKVAFISCWMCEQIRPEAWDNWNKPESEQTTFFCEYDSKGPGAAMDKRVSWAKILTPEQAAEYTVENVLSESDGWTP